MADPLEPSGYVEQAPEQERAEAEQRVQAELRWTPSPEVIREYEWSKQFVNGLNPLAAFRESPELTAGVMVFVYVAVHGGCAVHFLFRAG